MPVSSYARPLFAEDLPDQDRADAHEATTDAREGSIALAPALADQERDDRTDRRSDPDADASAAASADSNGDTSVDAEPELQIASVAGSLAMKPLIPRFNAIWPTRGQITTYFGEVGPTSPRGHAGLDIAAPWGTPVVAADDGEVLKAFWSGDGYGGLVIVAHPSGYETWYAHLARFQVAPGDEVKRGEQIGNMGSTGYSTGPHLHFEVRQDGQLRDPLSFLK